MGPDMNPLKVLSITRSSGYSALAILFILSILSNVHPELL
jgi:hypothetical protein